MSDFIPYYGREAHFQETAAIHLNLLGVLWFHPPNGGSRNAREAVNLKKQGVKPGVPDICIMEAKGKYNGLFIELKNEKGRLTNYQKEWLKRLNDNGYLAVCTNSLDEFIEIVTNYLKL